VVLLQLQVDKGQAGAAFGQLDGDAVADALPGSGHESDFSGQINGLHTYVKLLSGTGGRKEPCSVPAACQIESYRG
jgi:hypothetical protein